MLIVLPGSRTWSIGTNFESPRPLDLAFSFCYFLGLLLCIGSYKHIFSSVLVTNE